MKRAKKITLEFCKREIFQFAGFYELPNYLKEEKQYKEIVHTPMDLKTITDNLQHQKYATPREWLRDLKLVFQNTIDYWGEENAYAIIAKYGLEEIKRNTHGMDVGTTSAWMKQVIRVSEKLTKQIAEKPTQARDSKSIDELRSQVASDPVVKSENFRPLAESLNQAVLDDGIRQDIIEILKQTAGFSVKGDGSKPKPIDLGHLNETTVKILKRYVDNLR